MRRRCPCLVVILAFSAAGVYGQNQYVCTNNDPIPSFRQNDVSVFSMDKSGALTQIPGSPFGTGGLGGGGGSLPPPESSQWAISCMRPTR